MRALLEVTQMSQMRLEVAVLENGKPMKMLDSVVISEIVKIVQNEKELQAKAHKMKR